MTMGLLLLDVCRISLIATVRNASHSSELAFGFTNLVTFVCLYEQLISLTVDFTFKRTVIMVYLYPFLDSELACFEIVVVTANLDFSHTLA